VTDVCWLERLRRSLASSVAGRGGVEALQAGAAVLSLGVQLRPGLPLRGVRRCESYRRGRLGETTVAEGYSPAGTFALETHLSTLALAGVPRLFAVGAAGALDPDLEVGTVGIVRSAFAGEGVSPYFKRDGQIVDATGPGSNGLEAAASRCGVPVIELDVYTIGSILAETDDFLAEQRASGFQAVECEAAAALVLAEHYGMEASILLVISDSPARNVLPGEDFRTLYRFERGMLLARKVLMEVLQEIEPSSAQPLQAVGRH
jgi:nucleoside phosphorylase